MIHLVQNAPPPSLSETGKCSVPCSCYLLSVLISLCIASLCSPTYNTTNITVDCTLSYTCIILVGEVVTVMR